ncbi:MAG: pyridoxal-dependent decarboxylase, partial [Cyclobacteriaceae bacterium]|nr:pyridoxal-dependent decarboxylase [Cyclobacteriaceae bacterium]
GKNMQKAFSYEASYLQDASSYNQEISPADVSPELTKHFRGLRMWLPLILHGIEPFAACLEEKLLLANYFYDRIKTFEGFEVTHRPELSVVTYRYVPDSGNANKFNEALLKEIHTDGRVFISSTTLNGIFTLRLAVLAFRTHLRTIDLALEILKEKSEYLERNRNLWE